ncbi:hypothetical protein OAN61_00935, partial [bacterium]|nr:hypothetical protein [bacterium]
AEAAAVAAAKAAVAKSLAAKAEADATAAATAAAVAVADAQGGHEFIELAAMMNINELSAGANSSDESRQLLSSSIAASTSLEFESDFDALGAELPVETSAGELSSVMDAFDALTAASPTDAVAAALAEAEAEFGAMSPEEEELDAAAAAAVEESAEARLLKDDAKAVHAVAVEELAAEEAIAAAMANEVVAMEVATLAATPSMPTADVNQAAASADQVASAVHAPAMPLAESTASAGAPILNAECKEPGAAVPVASQDTAPTVVQSVTRPDRKDCAQKRYRVHRPALLRSGPGLCSAPLEVRLRPSHTWNVILVESGSFAFCVCALRSKCPFVHHNRLHVQERYSSYCKL